MRKLPYIYYGLPNGVKAILTSRPDSYTDEAVSGFMKEFNPKVRIQMTDDGMKKEVAKNIPMSVCN